MEKNNQLKAYQKPGWQKQEMFERFAQACDKLRFLNAGRGTETRVNLSW